MKRAAVAIALVSLCLPATALAARSSGVVLTVSAKRHSLQVIQGTSGVRSYRYPGRMAAIRVGSRVRFAATGRRITKLALAGHRVRQLTFTASVIRASAATVVVRLADGKPMVLHPVSVQGALWPGVAVRVTQRLGHRPTVTVASQHGRSAAKTASPGGQQLQAFGTVVEIDQGAFVVQRASGEDLRFSISPGDLYTLQLSLCNVVSVAYGPSSTSVTAGDVDIAENDSTSGGCHDPGAPKVSGTSDAFGPITKLTLSSVTVNTQNGPMTFAATIDLTDGYLVGDTVDVTYVQTNTGSLVASDVEPDDYDAVGSAEAVSSGSLTIRASDGHERTFTEDPSWGDFAGISVGDQVDVTYYYSNGHVVVDYVTDLSR